jgi:hypothetical protein
MKNHKNLIAAFICFFTTLAFSQKPTKEFVPADLTPAKKTTCWNVTKGAAAFGADICFNANSTAKHATGGFGGFRIVKNELILKDLNGKSIDSQKKLVYKIKSITKTKIELVDEKNTKIELTLKK